jgi:hypothetical protein
LTTDYSNLIQFPLAGQAMAIGYNLPELNATTDGGTLVPLPHPTAEIVVLLLFFSFVSTG